MQIHKNTILKLKNPYLVKKEDNLLNFLITYARK